MAKEGLHECDATKIHRRAGPTRRAARPIRVEERGDESPRLPERGRARVTSAGSPGASSLVRVRDRARDFRGAFARGGRGLDSKYLKLK